MATIDKYAGMLVEYLDENRLRAALATRELANQVTVIDASGNERRIARELILVSYPDRRTARENLRDSLTALNRDRERLAAEIDLDLLWQLVHEDDRGYSPAALAEIFFGRAGAVEVAVMLEALLNDRLYFIRRHMEFIARDADQVERLRLQQERMRLRSETGRQHKRMLAGMLADEPPPPPEEVAPLIADLTRYLENPFSRNRETSALLEAVAGELSPAEAAYEILARLGAPPPGPRFALIGGLRRSFADAAQREAVSVSPPERPRADPGWAVTIDDAETVEIDDAVSCDRIADGGFRVRVHIALVADFVTRGGAMDSEAAARGTTVYLPETTVRMLPDPVSTAAASLQAAVERPVLTTEARLSAAGELLSYVIRLERIRVGARLTYDQADRLLGLHSADADEALSFDLLQQLRSVCAKLRERRRAAGALLIHRREPKVTVIGNEIDIRIIDNSSPSRELIAECMILSNYIAARTAAERGVPMIFRVQPNLPDDMLAQRAKLSLYPGFHSGVGLDCYVQASSPIRRYVDLVLQRQLVAVSGEAPAAYSHEELMTVLAAAENTEADGRELERRARRYWTLIHLQRQPSDTAHEAIVWRDGSSAELEAYAVRGALRGAPNLAANMHIKVRVANVDPLRGRLSLSYLETISTAEQPMA